MVISKKTIIFSMVSEGGGGGGHLPGGVQLFPWGGGGGGVGSNANFYRTRITCDFPVGLDPLSPPLDPHMQLEIYSPENMNKITDVRALTCTTFHFIFSFYCFFI